MIDERILQEKARKYIVCFNGQCTQREHCLRWLVGQHVPETLFAATVVNPRFIATAGGECPAYRNDQPQRIHVGMVHFYDAMPGAMEKTIKARLIERYSRVVYYQYRRGERPITPEVEQEIERTCRECGWTAPLAFDSCADEVLW